jgi:hypothetical protein
MEQPKEVKISKESNIKEVQEDPTIEQLIKLAEEREQGNITDKAKKDIEIIDKIMNEHREQIGEKEASFVNDMRKKLIKGQHLTKRQQDYLGVTLLRIMRLTK